VDLAKADKLYKDAMETTASSGDVELADELLAFFIQASGVILVLVTIRLSSSSAMAGLVMQAGTAHGRAAASLANGVLSCLHGPGAQPVSSS
jgi:hypothetical protein